jgi:ABC-type nitrate/sulfonate/bicarbonate transport system permease component
MTIRRPPIRRVNVAGLAVVATTIAVWQLVAGLGLFSIDYLPTPVDVVGALGDLIRDGSLAADLGHTLGVTLVAATLAIAIGTGLGLAVGLTGWFDRLFTASFNVLRTVPLVALMPLALLIWGPAAKTEIIVAVYAAIWPMLVNAAGGVRAIHPRLHDVARTFRFSRARTVRTVIVPAAMPALLVGARLSVITALVVAIMGEMLINPQGLGWGLVRTQTGLQPEQMWAYAVVCGAIGYMLNVLLVRTVALALPGSSASTAAAR